ncbi:MAG: rod shape-determining protein RodA [Betaproteobacteria bacterium]|nr:MAG: rod shape-determining protein RodA [Betaproteobacteria bacterium]
MHPTVRRIPRLLTRHVDGMLLGLIVLVMGLGLLVLYSASNANTARVTAQLANMLIAVVVMWVFANIPPHYLMRLAAPLYVAGVLMLLGVAMYGEVAHGARRWLDLGITRVQPSELMKIALPLALACYLHRHEATLRFTNFAVATVMLIVPVALIARQPDLGTALLITASGFFVLFLAGLSWRIVAGAVLGSVVAAPFVWSLLHDYQRQRVLTLIDPTQDPLGTGYHTIQSTIAMGSGGWTGKGWLTGTQTHLDFIPERTTDFIFAVYAEEFGFAGSLVLLALLLLVIARGLFIAANAPTLFGRLLAGAITLTFFTYAFVNMGMVSGVLPVVGIPLPLISYGGTALVSICLGFGILMSIATHKRLIQT